MIAFFERRPTICGLAFGKKFLKVSASGFVFPPQQIFGEDLGWYVGWVDWVEIYFVDFPYAVTPSEGFRVACLPAEYWQMP